MAVDHTFSATVSAGPHRSPTRRQAWVTAAMLFVFMLINFADKAVLGLVGVDLIDDLGITPSQFGLVQSGFFWFFAIGAIVGGMLIGRIPGRWLLAGVALIWALCLLPMVWSTSFTVLLITRMILGFAEGPTAALAFGVTHSWFRAEKRALPTSIVASGTSVGPLVAAPIITALVIHYSWHAAFAAMAIVGLVWVVGWLIVGRDGPEVTGHAVSSFPMLPERVPYRRLLTSGTIVGITLLFFATYCSVALKISWLPLALRQGLGYDKVATGWLVSLPYLCGAILMIVFAAVSRAMTRRGASVRAARGLLPCALVALGGLSTIAWPLLDRGVLQIVLLAVGASLVVGAQGIAWTLVSDVVPVKQRGTVMGVMITCYSMGGVIAPLLLGNLVNDASNPLHGYQLGFAAFGVVLVGGALIAAALINPERNVACFVEAQELSAVRADDAASAGQIGPR
ncbi:MULTISPECIES: MFS transporter [Rhodococcus]|uniref:MFS transporter n=1 Tax=Rhodococcus aetherivorans TaxID=191292 RepID=A0AA46SA03_9NOCA|nr:MULTISPECIES: MFS transporter [Rhodococcus]AKE88224.1 MFS transporter permease [Rhodococcus aetherivorans]UGQ40943.1 MFS transporter [Rhodococcus aetherivorans]UYF94040.1 MFS transporter [Rhodococcus aetherivorans]